MRRKIIGGVVGISLVIGSLTTMYIKSNQNKIAHLMEVVVGIQEATKEDETYITKLLQKEEEQLTSDERFIVGYKYYNDQDLEKAQHYLETARTNKNSIAKIYSTVALVSTAMAEGDGEKCITLTKEMLESIGPEDYTESTYNTIMTAAQMALNSEEGRRMVQEQFKEVLEYSDKMERRVALSLRSNLGVMYFTNGNYAKGIEECLQVIAESEGTEHAYYSAKAYIDMGVTYGMLGDGKACRKYIEKGMNIPLDDAYDEASIKTYGAINLYDSILCEESYEEIQDVQALFTKYSQSLPEDTREVLSIMNDLPNARLALKTGKIEEAKKLISSIGKRLETTQTEDYIGIETTYALARAELYYQEGQIEEAIDYYMEALAIEDIQFRKSVLEGLVEVLNATGQYEAANVYERELQQWYENESRAVHKDYSDYALYKYENERKLREKAKKLMIENITIAIVSAIVVCIVLSMSLTYLQLRRINKSDSLTRIYNRNYFEKYYSEMLAGTKPFSVVIFDIDHFKAINDTYGHVVGDKVIRKVVELCQKVVSKRGVLFRYGGEEFVLLIEETDKEKLIALAESMRQAVASYEWGKRQITISMGIASSAADTRDVLHLADKMLYEAKMQGRNKVICNE